MFTMLTDLVHHCTTLVSTSDSSDEPNTLSIKKVLHADSMVVPPKDVIDTMALYVLDGGCAFERAIMDPLFNFFFELGSKKSTYYIWRLYSLPLVTYCSYIVWMDVIAVNTTCYITSSISLTMELNEY